MAKKKAAKKKAAPVVEEVVEELEDQGPAFEEAEEVVEEEFREETPVQAEELDVDDGKGPYRFVSELVRKGHQWRKICNLAEEKFGVVVEGSPSRYTINASAQ